MKKLRSNMVIIDAQYRETHKKMKNRNAEYLINCQ